MNQSLFPGVPRIESPLFVIDELVDLSANEQRIARDLNRQGYAVLDFPDEGFGARVERIQSNLGPRFDLPFDDPSADKTRGERRIQDAWRFDDDVKEIAANPEILALLGKLYGRAAFPFQTLNFPVGTQQGVHSDSVHFSSQPERFMCGVWVAMEDVSADAGPLFYLPESHKCPIVTNAMIGRRGYGSELKSAQEPFAKAWDALSRAHGFEPAPFLAKKGQALIWTANLLHGGSRQTDSTLTRWSQVTHYFFDDCIYYTPAFSDEALGKLQTRELVSVVDGGSKPNSYLGELIANVSSSHSSVFTRARTKFRQFLDGSR
ncbi:MAG: phytanoyl-CoA dioxygenase family protein [Pseudomonadota bacterium]